jgi:hypothetical protein
MTSPDVTALLGKSAMGCCAVHNHYTGKEGRSSNKMNESILYVSIVSEIKSCVT